MKKLLLIAALVAPAWLFSCVTHVKPPTAATVIKEAHEAFPEVREIPIVQAPGQVLTPLPSYKPKAKHVDRPSRAAPARPVPRPRPPVDQVEVEELPPQAGVICIFPFNLIPTCTPEPAGRLP